METALNIIAGAFMLLIAGQCFSVSFGAGLAFITVAIIIIVFVVGLVSLEDM